MKLNERLNIVGDYAVMAQTNPTTEFDQRKSERTDVDDVAFISVSGSSTRCRVVNLSTDGAAIDVPDAHCIPNRFELMTETDRVVRTCRLVWIRDNRIGVEFDPEPEETGRVTHRDRQFLQYLRDGQWQRSAALSGGERLISRLLNNGWIESRRNDQELSYRITPKGLAAKMVKV